MLYHSFSVCVRLYVCASARGAFCLSYCICFLRLLCLFLVVCGAVCMVLCCTCSFVLVCARVHVASFAQFYLFVWCTVWNSICIEAAGCSFSFYPPSTLSFGCVCLCVTCLPSCVYCVRTHEYIHFKWNVKGNLMHKCLEVVNIPRHHDHIFNWIRVVVIEPLVDLKQPILLCTFMNTTTNNKTQIKKNAKPLHPNVGLFKIGNW